MTSVIVLVGAGSIGQAIARRVGAGKHILLADLRQENAAAAAKDDFDALFAPLEADPQDMLYGVHDMANMALAEEPQRVRDDLDAMRARHSAGADS